ncbi:MAG: response regulator [Eubacteriales bacterium]|nr:response regulator [Eubacteriales bacterium]
MYRVLIVDDELPALRFVSSIIEKFSQSFKVAGTVSSGELALNFLQKQTVDLLITDISMHGMNGIELALAARRMQPNIHIVIISGYGEFEYAQGAIQAGVDDYLLKPVSVTKITAILQSIQEKLEAKNTNLSASILPALACRQPYVQETAARLYGRKSYRFAFLRWGNLDMTLPKNLSATSLILPTNEQLYELRGRDDEERILIAEDQGIDEFLSRLSVYMTQHGSLPTWTAVYTPISRPIEELADFVDPAINLVYQRTVIGRHQIMQFSGGTNPKILRLPAADLKQLAYFVSFDKTRMIREYFASLAVSWERANTPQRQVWHMGRQVIHQIAAVSQPVAGRLEEVLQEFNQQLLLADSYSDLMRKTYALLFEDGSARDRKMSTRELYDYAISYIEENYVQPLSMQSLCDELGISQTYLSRLFRKYSSTTFNAYLTKCRMEAAMQLLREKPELLLRDVAACVGYEDSSYFTKVFRQYTGKNPSQWVSGE